MSQAVAPSLSLHRPLSKQPVSVRRPTREEAEEAVRTLIRWAGDDPAREGLRGPFFRSQRADRSIEVTCEANLSRTDNIPYRVRN